VGPALTANTPHVLVVGAGISGAACAAALRSAGIGVTVRERGRAPGGRLAAPTLHGRRVDLGAAYFTVKDDAFGAVVEDWTARGRARQWTDTFETFDTAAADSVNSGDSGADSNDGWSSKTGPMRWAAPDGLRSLARDVLVGADLTLESEVTDARGDGHAAVVLAMPDPQAARLVPSLPDAVDYEPVIAVAAGWPHRCWPITDAAFVNGDPDVSFVADDGARRGDGAAVLVAHTTADRARRHLAAPDAAIAPVLQALRRVLGVDAQPSWTHVHRWTFAKPTGTHGDQPFLLTPADDHLLGVCSDSWCPQGSPRVESAWLSGHRLGTELARRLTAV
jgi:renalase